MVTLRIAPPDCAATVIDRGALRAGGATALNYGGGSFERTAARPEGQDRPWARSRSAPPRTRTPAPQQDRRDATPPGPDTDAEE